MLLSLILVITMIPTYVFAADDTPTVTLTADKTTVAKGEEITLTASIDKAVTNAYLWQWNIVWDSTYFEEPVMTKGDAYKRLAVNANATTYYATPYMGSSVTSGNSLMLHNLEASTLCTLTLKAKEDITEEKTAEFYLDFIKLQTGYEDEDFNIIGQDYEVITDYEWGKNSQTKPADDVGMSVTVTLEKPSTDIAVTGVTLDKETLALTVGGTETLTATVAPENATNKTVTWTSSDETVATVANGVVTAVKAGEAIITAKAGEIEATCAVTVSEETSEESQITEIYYYNDETKTPLTFTKSEQGMSGTYEGKEYTNLPAYQVTVPADFVSGTTVYIKYPSTQTIVKYSLSYNEDGFGTNVSGAEVDAENNTLKIPAESYVVDTNTYYVTINGNYEPFMGFNFVRAAAETVPVEGVTLDQTALSLEVDGTATLAATVTPTEATDKTVTWTSSDETVATVANGVVTAVKAGTATITAKAGEIEATCAVTVTAKQTEEDDDKVNVATNGSAAADVTVPEATPGQDLTIGFTEEAAKKADYYDYTFTIKGTEVAATPNPDGTYTIDGEYIEDGVEITITKEGKKYEASTPTQDEGIALEKGELVLPENQPQYDVDYAFKLNRQTGYQYVVSIKIGGNIYDTPTPISSMAVESEDTYIIPGEDITGNVEITVSKVQATGSVYTVTMPADMDKKVGDTVEISPVIAYTDDTVTTYNAYDMIFTYNPEELGLLSTKDNVEGLTGGNGIVRVQRYGDAKDIGTAPFTLKFKVLATGEATITATSAKVDIAANSVEFNAPEATLIDSQTTITSAGYSVTLPEGFEGESIANPGEDYTFTLPEDSAYNDYTVTVTIGGTPYTPDYNAETGVYTISSTAINGEIVVSAEKEGKEYDVTVNGAQTNQVTYEDKATYGKDYSFTVDAITGYNTEVTVKINSENYTNLKASEGTYTIEGTDIKGDVEITVTNTASEITVTFDGNATADVTEKPEKLSYGEDYTFKVTKTAGYTYTVTATMGGNDVIVTEGEDENAGEFTIKDVTANLAITVNKAVTAAAAAEISAYVELDGETVFLVKLTGELADGKVYTYNGQSMFYSEVYDAWCYLAIADKNVETDSLKNNIAIADGEKVTLTVKYDVNETGLVDINDAQLVYDIYNGKYTDFEEVSMSKFLNADVNGDAIVNVNDAVKVVSEIE